MRVLIIDDEENIRRITAAAVEGMGHEAAVAEDGETALKQLAAGSFDAALLDLRLQNENGIDLLPRLLEIEPALGVIMISGHASPENVKAARQAGAVAFMAKPYTPEEIRRALGNLPGQTAGAKSGR